MWTRKSLNARSALAGLAMMMLGGSPTRVAAPPMLEAKTSAIRYGAARRPSRSQTRNVTGAISSTVVTLSSSADAKAVSSTSSTISTYGRPRLRLAAQMATYSKTPVWRSTETITIIPNSRKMTFHSTPVCRLKNAFSASVMWSSSIRAAPPRATLVRWMLVGDQERVGADEDDEGGDRHGTSRGRDQGHADQTSRHTSCPDPIG